MELSEVILALVGVISTGTIFVIKQIMTDIRVLETTMTNCQTSMPKEYVLKADHTLEISELKGMIASQSKKIDQIWKHMRVDK